LLCTSRLRFRSAIRDNASRDLNEARAALEQAQAEFTACAARHSETDRQLARDRAALDELRRDPVMRLTVPFFAAASSHYASTDYPHAPRLVLLDEAFAGIDDEALADCMGLIREFDLDFVMTSEREWGCYAELPGLAISHLVRRDGVDAVYVSRWSWDGRARREEPDPSRRSPETASASA
jgi:hypothetical protein